MNERHNFILENEAEGEIVETCGESAMNLPRLSLANPSLLSGRESKFSFGGKNDYNFGTR